MRHLRHAEGWLELGAWREANQELEEIQAPLRADPKVLDIRWQVYATAGKWDVAVEISGLLLRHQEKKRAAETMYQLARFACRLNRVEEARRWLEKAIGKSDKKMKLRAISDPQLEKVWEFDDLRN